MGTQAIRQRARRAAMQASATQRREQRARERRLALLMTQVLSALGERDSAIATTERRAGLAIEKMTAGEGLSLKQAAAWMAGQVSPGEVARLRRAARTDVP